jgi:hypothetical protein
MNATLNRQLKDIQYQAEKLISGSPQQEELERFSNYNEELRDYILTNIDVPEIKDLANATPNILEVENEMRSAHIVAIITIAIVTLGTSALYISYVTNMRRKRLIQSNIQTARGKYASIEFLLKAQT